jgi:hypothetical protein
VSLSFDEKLVLPGIGGPYPRDAAQAGAHPNGPTLQRGNLYTVDGGTPCKPSARLVCAIQPGLRRASAALLLRSLNRLRRCGCNGRRGTVSGAVRAGTACHRPKRRRRQPLGAGLESSLTHGRQHPFSPQACPRVCLNSAGRGSQVTPAVWNPN